MTSVSPTLIISSKISFLSDDGLQVVMSDNTGRTFRADAHNTTKLAGKKGIMSTEALCQREHYVNVSITST